MHRVDGIGLGESTWGLQSPSAGGTLSMNSLRFWGKSEGANAFHDQNIGDFYKLSVAPMIVLTAAEKDLVICIIYHHISLCELEHFNQLSLNSRSPELLGSSFLVSNLPLALDVGQSPGWSLRFGDLRPGGQYLALQLLQHQPRARPPDAALSLHCGLVELACNMVGIWGSQTLGSFGFKASSRVKRWLWSFRTWIFWEKDDKRLKQCHLLTGPKTETAKLVEASVDERFQLEGLQDDSERSNISNHSVDQWFCLRAFWKHWVTL